MTRSTSRATRPRSPRASYQAWTSPMAPWPTCSRAAPSSPSPLVRPPGSPWPPIPASSASHANIRRAGVLGAGLGDFLNGQCKQTAACCQDTKGATQASDRQQHTPAGPRRVAGDTLNPGPERPHQRRRQPLCSPCRPALDGQQDSPLRSCYAVMRYVGDCNGEGR